VQAQAIAGDGPAVVVEHDREPRPRRLVVLVQDPQVERGVVGLPGRVRGRGLVAVEQIEGLLVGLGPLMGQDDQARIEMAHDVVDAPVAGHGPSLLPRHGRHLTVDARHTRRRPAQRQALDQLDQEIGEASPVAIVAGRTRQSGQALLPIPPQLALGGAQRHAGLARHLGE